MRFLAFVRFDRDPAKPLSKTEHERWQLIRWIYLTGWLSIALLIFFVFSVSGVVKLLLYLVLAISAPGITDLFESYDAYLKRREKIKPLNK